ncbi:hypothetical protein DVH05_006487 [Phytophthora capsici]|nr:hypothetical protein DVH05_006487 [Phytophthora capsici]|eukprot:jgi/Phyca11/111059/e_gw1.19.295.1
MCRGQQSNAATSSIEALDVDDGRTRKISAKWRQKQQQQRNSHDDGIWPQSAGTEMHMGFNAFDFSSSPEAFYEDTEELVKARPEMPVEDEEEKRRQHMANVAKQVTAMGFNSASLWEQSFPGLRQPGGPIRQLPAYGHGSMNQSLWRPPVTYEDQRRALCQQPGYPA